MMRVLAVDTSSDLGGVAIREDGESRVEMSARVRARHGETLLPLVDAVLRAASLERRAIDLLVCGLGPGSFTGTRIGVATAKGLAIALQCPLVGISSLRAMAELLPGSWRAPLIDAYKGEVYGALYRLNAEQEVEEVLPPFHASPRDAAARLVASAEGTLSSAGSAWRRYPELAEVMPIGPCEPWFDHPRAVVLAALGEMKYRREGVDESREMVPFYVRPSDAVLPKPVALPFAPLREEAAPLSNDE